jgi:hypothetical protein
MPPLLAALPLIAAIGGLAGTGVGLGLELSNRPGTPKATTADAGATAATNNANLQAEKAAISQQTPNVNAATSGLANPDYVASIAQLLAGTAGNPGSSGAAQQAIAQAFGLPSPGSGTTGTTPGQATSTSNFTPAGSNPSPAAQNGPVNLSDFVTRFLNA